MLNIVIGIFRCSRLINPPKHPLHHHHHHSMFFRLTWFGQFGRSWPARGLCQNPCLNASQFTEYIGCFFVFFIPHQCSHRVTCRRKTPQPRGGVMLRDRNRCLAAEEIQDYFSWERERWWRRCAGTTLKVQGNVLMSYNSRHGFQESMSIIKAGMMVSHGLKHWWLYL